MKNITIATDYNVAYFKIMIESCKRNNIECIVLGKGEKWEGLSSKYKIWKKYLDTLPGDELVMINDAYDVIFLESAEEIVKKFLTFNKPVVLSIQKGQIINVSYNKCNNFVVCTGNIIGYVKYIREFINIILGYQKNWSEFDGDQNIFNKICSIEPFINSNIGIDSEQKISYVTSLDSAFELNYIFGKKFNGIKMENGKILKNNNETISILHLAGNVKGNKYLKYLNYDTDKIGKMGNYKFKQFGNGILQTIEFKSKYFTLIIILIFIGIIVLKKNKLI